MAFTLEEVKDYLRVDDDSDDGQLTAMMEFAKQYIIIAVGEFDETNPTAVMLAKAITQDVYDHRELMQSDQQQKKSMEYVYKSMVLQLQTARLMKANESVTS